MASLRLRTSSASSSSSLSCIEREARLTGSGARPLAIGGKESGKEGSFHLSEFFSSEAARVKRLRWFGTPGQW